MQNSVQLSGCKAGFCGSLKINGLQAIAIVGTIMVAGAIYVNYLNNQQRQLCLKG